MAGLSSKWLLGGGLAAAGTYYAVVPLTRQSRCVIRFSVSGGLRRSWTRRLLGGCKESPFCVACLLTVSLPRCTEIHPFRQHPYAICIKEVPAPSGGRWRWGLAVDNSVAGNVWTMWPAQHTSLAHGCRKIVQRPGCESARFNSASYFTTCCALLERGWRWRGRKLMQPTPSRPNRR